MSTIPPLRPSPYSLTLTLPSTDLAAVDPRVRAALSAEGFGILTEINVQATLHKKLGVETRPYVILGACNPALAHEALQAEPTVGVLLPCNVVVAEDDDGGVTVSAIDPVAMFSVVGRPEIEPLALAVRERLERVLAALEG